MPVKAVSVEEICCWHRTESPFVLLIKVLFKPQEPSRHAQMNPAMLFQQDTKLRPECMF